MCTSIVSNRGKTLIGWNLDILDMEYEYVLGRLNTKKIWNTG